MLQQPAQPNLIQRWLRLCSKQKKIKESHNYTTSCASLLYSQPDEALMFLAIHWQHNSLMFLAIHWHHNSYDEHTQ